MALRSPHGTAAKRGLPGPRVETQPIDEQPAGVPAPAEPDGSAGRRADGRFLPGNPWAEKGGRIRAAKAKFAAKLADSLGLGEVSDEMRPFVEAGQEFVAAKLAWLASISGGEVGPGPSSMVQSAALDLVMSRYYFARFQTTGDGSDSDRGSKHSAASAQRLMAARELAVKDAEVRARLSVDRGALPWETDE